MADMEDWGAYDVNSKIDRRPLEEEVQSVETSPQWLARQAVRGTSRAAESLLGLPGDVLLGLQNIIGAGVEKVTGLPSRLREQVLPGSQQIREYVTEPIAEKLLPKDFIKAQSQTEGFLDDIVGDFASFMIPIKGKIPFTRSFAAALLGNSAKKIAETIGASPLGQMGAKTVGMFLPFFIGPKVILKQATKHYEKARTALSKLPKNVPVTTKYMKPLMDELAEDFLSGGTTTEGKKILVPIIETIVNATKRGKTNLRNLWRIYSDNNKNFKSHGHIADVAPTLGAINSTIRETIRHATKQYPEFSKNALNAVNMWKGIYDASVARKFLRNVSSGEVFKSKFMKFLLTYKPLKTVQHMATVYPVAKIWDVMETLGKSSSARKFYAKTLLHAHQRNAPAVLKSMRQLDQALVTTEADSVGEEWGPL